MRAGAGLLVVPALAGVLCVGMPGLGGVAVGQVVVDTFDPGSNTGGWSFFGPGASVLPVGGNPGAYLDQPGIDTFAPFLRSTTTGSAFTGDYRTREVTRMGVDLVLFQVDFSAEGRPLSLVLMHDNGTPGNPNDDWGAFTMHPQNIPLPGQGWRSYAFDVPSQSATLPAGWDFIEFGPGANPNWNTLIGNVRQAGFFYGDPRNLFIFQMWHTGADNVFIETVPAPGALGLCSVMLAIVARRRAR